MIQILEKRSKPDDITNCAIEASTTVAMNKWIKSSPRWMDSCGLYLKHAPDGWVDELNHVGIHSERRSSASRNFCAPALHIGIPGTANASCSSCLDMLNSPPPCHA